MTLTNELKGLHRQVTNNVKFEEISNADREREDFYY